METTIPKANRLIHASSPYLLQHAYNPVDWYEWGEEALQKARRENKLILVSIGYSACHWCHVMEHECFEKEDTAAIMNKHFVCIKVDREERPDIDQLYMDALQLLTGRGGWPLNMFTLPDGRPLHGGTYFPKTEFETTLNALTNLWENEPEKAMEFATKLARGVKSIDQFEYSADSEKGNLLIRETLEKWQENFDLNWGGYTWAPKFMMPSNWDLFMQYGHYFNNQRFKDAVEITLDRMALSGTYDQVGGGFCRYSTDSFWKVPHFEKMLYDNAQLLGLYGKAWSAYRKPLYAQLVNSMDGFLQRELKDHSGLYYSALDADSEGEEGKFYCWTEPELKQLCGAQFDLVKEVYALEENGNWEHGKNILHCPYTLHELQTRCGMSLNAIQEQLDAVHARLLEARNKRVRPGLDDKLLCSWNALLAKGYAEAGMAMNRPDLIDKASSLADKILEVFFVNEVLYRVAKGNEVKIEGFAEDFACLIDALIHVAEASFRDDLLHKAHSLMQQCINRFYDTNRQLFTFTPIDRPELLTRKLDVNDDVIPSANSILARCLFKLHYYFENESYLDKLETMQGLVAGKFARYPGGFANWMQVMLLQSEGFEQVLGSGPEAAKELGKLRMNYKPNRICFEVKVGSSIPLFSSKPVGTETRFWICEDKTCGLPLGTLPN